MYLYKCNVPNIPSLARTYGTLSRLSKKPMGLVHQFLFLFLALAQSLAYFTTTGESIQPFKPPDSWGSGCSFVGMRISYRCQDEARESAAVPQMLSFRVDCREAHGNFHNLTLFDRKGWCGKLVYTRYAKTSSEMEEDPTAPWLPLVHDHTVTIQKGEVFDLECIPLRTFAWVRAAPSPGSDNTEWKLPLSILVDGKEEDASCGSVQFAAFSLLYPQTFLTREWESCVSVLQRTYAWKMTLTKSINYTHWVSFSSRALQRPGIFPKIDLCSSVRSDVSRVNKDTLHLTILEEFGDAHLTKLNQKWLVRVDPHFYGATSTLNSYSADFKLEVNEDAFLTGVQNVTVKLGLGLHSSNFATLLLPVNKTSVPVPESKSRGASWVWFIVAFMLMFLVAAVGYVYRRDLFPWMQPPGSNPADQIEMQGSWEIKSCVRLAGCFFSRCGLVEDALHIIYEYKLDKQCHLCFFA